MENLSVKHECGGDLKHLYNRHAIRHGEIVTLEVYQCLNAKCCQLVEHEVPGEDVTEINLAFLS